MHSLYLWRRRCPTVSTRTLFCDSAIRSKQSEYMTQEITRNITLQKNTNCKTRTDGPWRPARTSLNVKTLNFRWQQMGFTVCQGNWDAHIFTDVCLREYLEYDALHSSLFWGGLFMHFHVQETEALFFFYCLACAVQLLLYKNKP